MSVEVLLVAVCAVLLVVSAVLALARIVRGPSVLDRTVASEVMISILIAAFGLHAAVTRSTTTLPILVALALVGFVGSVTIARFVARDHDRGSDAPDPGGITRQGADAHDLTGPSGSRGAGGAAADPRRGREVDDV